MLLRSAAQLNLPLLVLDPLHLELLLFSRSYVKSDSATSMFGLTRADLVFSPPATDAMHSDFSIAHPKLGQIGTSDAGAGPSTSWLGVVLALLYPKRNFLFLLCGLGCSDFVFAFA